MRDKFLTEAMGGCWHEVFKHDGENGTSTKCAWCPKCEKRIWTTDFYPPHSIAIQDNDFTTWEGFGKLVTWAKDQSWFYDLCQIPDIGNTTNHNAYLCLRTAMIDPDRFADAVYKFLKELESMR